MTPREIQSPTPHRLLLAVGLFFIGGLGIGWMCIDTTVIRHERAVQRLQAAVLQGDEAELAESRADGAGELTSADLECALRLAALYGREAHLRQLLIAGVDPNGRDDHDHTALMTLAMCPNSLEMARDMLAFGADANATDRAGRTALMNAVGARQTGIVRLLLDAGAEVRAIDHKGECAMSEAVRTGDANLISQIEQAEEKSWHRAKNARGGRISSGKMPSNVQRSPV